MFCLISTASTNSSLSMYIIQSMTMLPYNTTLLVILIVAMNFVPLGSANLVDSTCKSTPNYQLCVSILRADPKSSGANVYGLALIMVDSLKSKCNSALQIINQLWKSKPSLRAPLSECSKDYKFILRYDITEAVEALTKGDPKFAEDGTRDAAYNVQQCEDGFKSSPSPSPIANVNKAARDIAAVSTAIIRLLL